MQLYVFCCFINLNSQENKSRSDDLEAVFTDSEIYVLRSKFEDF